MADLIDDLREIDWNVFIEGPPKPGCPPEHMLRYLTRYMTGGPISDKRIIGEKSGHIWFNIRRRDKQAGQEPFWLPVVEFVRRWTMHILPKEFTKVRHFGCWTSTKRSGYLKACSQLLAQRHSNSPVELAQSDEAMNSPATNPVSQLGTTVESIVSHNTELNQARSALNESVSQTTGVEQSNTQSLNRSIADTPADINETSSADLSNCRSKGKRCPTCQVEMKIIEQTERPAWRELFYGPEHPWWFEWTSLGKKPPQLESQQTSASELSGTVRLPVQVSVNCLTAQRATIPASELEQDIFDQVIAMIRELKEANENCEAKQTAKTAR